MSPDPSCCRRLVPRDSARAPHRRWALAVLAVALAAGCKRAPQQYKETRPLMGTLVSITTFGEDREKLREATTAAFQRMKEAAALFNKYDKTSELSKLNQAGQGKSEVVSDELALVLKKSLEVSDVSGGAFDVSVGPLLKLWREAGKAGERPEATALADAKRRVGYKHLQLDQAKRSVALTAPGMQLDLGGIAKGFVVDEGVRTLAARGVTHALVDAGGDLYARGERPGNEGGLWHVGVRDPSNRKAILAQTLALKELAVATSGDYERYVEIEGERFSHIVDPRTGNPVKQSASVTIIAKDTMTADALATAVSVLGPVEGLKLIESLPGVEAMVITRAGRETEIARSSGFARFERE